MRLTLRTLLAYLDNTLEEYDAANLRVKIEESHFASNLIAEIEQAVASKSVDAYSPLAVGPLNDANAISEYLDSTLSAEQVAELERVCLESKTSLAEAAACHQILTMVLGTPSTVPEDLRRRIYDLADRGVSVESFSAVDMPDPSAGTVSDLAGATQRHPPDASDLKSAGDGSLSPTPPPVERVVPAGPADSGAYRAATRIRETPTPGERNPEATTRPDTTDPRVLTPAQRAALHRSEMYGGVVRPSRITPWLVTLGLLALLLFVMGNIFRQADFTRRSRDSGLGADTNRPDGTELDLVEAPDSIRRQTPPATSEPPPRANQTRILPVTEPATETPARTQPQTEEPPTTGPRSDTADRPIAGESPPKKSEVTSPARGEQVGAGVPGPDSGTDGGPVDGLAKEPSSRINDVAPPSVGPVAKRLADPAVVLFQDDTLEWKRLPVKSLVAADSKLTVPPLFKATFATASNVDCSLLGPCIASFGPGDAAAAAIHCVLGKTSMLAVAPESTIELRYQDDSVSLFFPDAQSQVVTDLLLKRRAGDTINSDRGRITRLTVTAVEGTCHVTTTSAIEGPKTVMIRAGESWERDHHEPESFGVVKTKQPAAAEPDGPTVELDRSARRGMEEFLENGQTVEIAMNEALAFRRAEVGALAAKTLVLMNRADALFRPGGAFHNAEHRLHWSSQLELLQQVVAINPQRASEARDQIRRADQANSDALIRLLRGYSQSQLERGSDRDLVDFLASETMSIRVLAIENLRQITGRTLNYRADAASESRRTANINKWQVLLRRGEIRRVQSP